jgi:hypothetical protein
MFYSFQISEIIIEISTQNQVLALVNFDLLRNSNVIPEKWKLCENPIQDINLSQLSFANGITLICNSSSIYLIEKISNWKKNRPNYIDFLLNLILKFPNIEFNEMSFSINGHASFGSNVAKVHDFITTKLLSPGPWQDFGNPPVFAKINYLYRLDRKRLDLTVQEGVYQESDNEELVVYFSGKFNYIINSLSCDEKRTSILAFIPESYDDIGLYEELVLDKFLGS